MLNPEYRRKLIAQLTNTYVEDLANEQPMSDDDRVTTEVFIHATITRVMIDLERIGLI